MPIHEKIQSYFLCMYTTKLQLFILYFSVYAYECPEEFSNLKGVNMCILHVPNVNLFLFHIGMMNNNTWYFKWTRSNLILSFPK